MRPLEPKSDVRFLDRANSQAAAGATGEVEGDPYNEDAADFDGPDEPVPF